MCVWFARFPMTCDVVRAIGRGPLIDLVDQAILVVVHAVVALRQVAQVLINPGRGCIGGPEDPGARRVLEIARAVTPVRRRIDHVPEGKDDGGVSVEQGEIRLDCRPRIGITREIERVMGIFRLVEEDVRQFRLDIVVPGDHLGSLNTGDGLEVEEIGILGETCVVDGSQEEMGTIVVGTGLKQGVEPVIEARLELGDQALCGALLGAAAGVHPGVEDEPEDDRDDDHHHEQLDQGESTPDLGSWILDLGLVSHGTLASSIGDVEFELDLFLKSEIGSPKSEMSGLPIVAVDHHHGRMRREATFVIHVRSVREVIAAFPT